MPENKVFLYINNRFYEGWESVSITSELNTIARSFELGLTLTGANGFDLSDFLVGSSIQLCIDDELILTGYIEQTPVSYDAHQRRITIAGRSKTGDLIDCCAYPSNEEISSIKELNRGWIYRAQPSGVIVEPAQMTARNWKSEKIEKIIATLIAPYNIRLVSQVNSQEIKNNFTITVTDKIIDSIRNLTKNRDYLFTDDPNGDLVIVKKASVAPDNAAVLELGRNVLKASASFDGTKLYSHYGVVGQEKGTNTASGNKICKEKSVVNGQNRVANRVRYIYEKAKGQSNSVTCEKEALGNQKYADNEFYKRTYTVQGWRDSNNELWKVNTIVKVKDDFLKQNDNYLVQKVTFSLTNQGGMTTELDVVPPDGFRIEEPSAKEKAQQNGNLNSSKVTSPTIKVNKNQYKTKLWPQN